MSARCCNGLCWLPDIIQFNLIQYEVKHEESWQTTTDRREEEYFHINMQNIK